MGQKYSINSAGRIVAERDIYSLGGFIPKGRVGAKIADESQLSQNGECWVAGGDISTRPDVIVKDNAYIGDFSTGTNPVHTDIITEFSGNTLIPGYLSVRCFAADTKNNTFIKDSFIGVTMDVLFGVSSKCHPVEQGRYNQDAPKGTLFTSASMKLDASNFVRNTATVRLGKDTYIYLPAGFNARIYWAYYDVSNQLAYAGESETVSSNLYKLSHPVYNVCMIAFAKNPTLTPSELEASGAKILGHVSGSLLIDLHPESVSGEYVISDSSLIMNTDNFGLATTQLRFLAGGLFNTNMYTPTNRQDYKPYGTFRNVERLEYTKYLGDAYRTVGTRDRAVSAYDCPLLRLDDLAFNDTMIQLGDLTLRRCIVPKGVFRNDAVNGNTYEDIDFSYANEDLGLNISGYTNFLSSHKEGLYRLDLSGGFTNGLVSHKGNLDSSAKLFPDIEITLLDGNIIEQGAYLPAFDKYYEDQKTPVADRVRTGKPLPTKGAIFPTITTGFKVSSIVYLRDDFRIQTSQTDPTSIDTANPYFVMNIAKTDNSPITASEFVSLGLLLRRSEYSKVPEITGSAYVGAGCTVRGDVQLHGDPYVNRVFDVNLWEWGSITESSIGNGWDAAKNPPGGPTEVDRRRLKEVIQVEPGAKITCNSGYWFNCYVYAFDGTYLDTSNWSQSWTVTPSRAAFVGVILKKSEVVGGTGYIEDSDIPLANVKYLRAFKKIRYITNELDRKSPEDISIGPDYWEQGTAGGGQADAGKTYEELKAASGTTIRLKHPINVSPLSSISTATGFVRFIRVLDAATKFHLDESLSSAKMALLAAIIQKGPSAATIPSDITNARLVLEFVPQPRIIAPYGVANVWLESTRIRMYDNSVLSRTITNGRDVVLKGGAVMGRAFIGDVCMCSNGHSDAIIKLP